MKHYFLLSIFFLLSGNIFGQFGQNRVQYKEYDWYFIQSKHFDIYFSLEGKEIAEFTSHAAEEALERIQNDLNFQINSRIALIVYNSHNDFQETNTTDSYISQGVGGFTEPFKNRVVFPFEGSYEKFRHVIHHELVHAVMRDMLYGGTVQNIISRGITLQLPLWYHEGMAEYLSSDWETNSDMFLRDAIINEYLPDINGLGGYFAYRGGQALFRFISETYGREKIGEMLSKIQTVGNVNEGIKASIGLSIEELNERWKKDLKRRYWPEIRERKDPSEFAKQITDNKKVGGFYNTSPAISPNGEKLVFISDRDIFLDIYLMKSLKKPEDVDKIISSGKTNDFEELNVLFPSITWAPDNERIALSRKNAGYDQVYIYNTKTGNGENLPFSLNGIESISWSFDGNLLSLKGSDTKQSDIYIYNFTTSELTKVTDDIFSDETPTWFKDNKRILFASDRGDYLYKEDIPNDFSMVGHNYNTDLYIVNIETGKIERITDWPLSSEKSAIASPDGEKIIFVSDYNGIDNIYIKRIKLTERDSVNSILQIPANPLTNSLNGLNQLTITEDGNKLYFTSLYNTGYNIFSLNNPFEIEVLDSLKPTEFMSEQIAKFYGTDIDSAISNEDSLKNEIVMKENSVNDDSLNFERRNRIFSGQYNKPSEKDSTKKDYSRYIFGDNDILSVSSTTPKDTIDREKLFSENLDDNGNFLVNRYKISFSPDIVYANAGFSTYYGLLGTTVLSFSDMLGNHRLIGVTSLQIDLKNSDYGLAYYYLPKRVDIGVEAFHTARFVYLTKNNNSDLHRFRNFGAILSASYPLSRFYRLDVSFSFLNVSSENLDSVNDPKQNSAYYVPSVSFVKDNTFFGYTSPIEGNRYRISLFGDIGLSDSKRSFYSFTFDFRQYYRFFFDNSFAIRFSGGYSGGGNPQRFFLGGTDSWVNREFATGDIPLDNPSDFAFLTPALPMRGYDYAQQIGTRYSLVNLELRLPVIRYLVTGPLPLLFSNVLGVAYVDAGTAWNDDNKLQLFRKDSGGKTLTKDLLLGTGYGFRMYFIFLWRMDIAWSYDLKNFSEPKYYFSLGLDF